MNAGRVSILLAHALVGWALCDATTAIGLGVTTLDRVLVVHAIAAPVFFAAISRVYFWRFHYTSPLATAIVFVAFVTLADFLVAALRINDSEALFGSLFGMWLPLAMIFVATYLTGWLVVGRQKAVIHAPK